MTDIDEGERPTCPICGDETYGRPCERSYCAGHRAGYQRGHEAGHEDAGLAAIARASAAYEAGYAACRETMTPAVLATEDAYLLGHEAGRLAVYRGDVERALLDPNVGLLVVLPRHERHVASLEHELAHDLLEVDRRIAERDLGWARAYVRQLTMQIADLTRWLEATQ